MSPPITAARLHHLLPCGLPSFLISSSVKATAAAQTRVDKATKKQGELQGKIKGINDKKETKKQEVKDSKKVKGEKTKDLNEKRKKDKESVKAEEKTTKEVEKDFKEKQKEKSKKIKEKPPEAFEVASVLYGPSYISFESSLNLHGWIPESVPVFTSACSKRSKKFENILGTFVYYNIPISIFHLGVSIPAAIAAVCPKLRRKSTTRTCSGSVSARSSNTSNALGLGYRH